MKSSSELALRNAPRLDRADGRRPSSKNWDSLVLQCCSKDSLKECVDSCMTTAEIFSEVMAIEVKRRAA